VDAERSYTRACQVPVVLRTAPARERSTLPSPRLPCYFVLFRVVPKPLYLPRIVVVTWAAESAALVGSPVSGVQRPSGRQASTILARAKIASTAAGDTTFRRKALVALALVTPSVSVWMTLSGLKMGRGAGREPEALFCVRLTS
jgi:hypothetical protein